MKWNKLTEILDVIFIPSRRLELCARVGYSDQGGAEVKLEPEKLSGLDPHHSTQLCFHPPTALMSF